MTQRSRLCPPECKYDFPDVNGSGGRLLKVNGPPIHPGWSAEYSVPTPKVNICRFCNKPVGDEKDEDRGATIVAIASKVDPRIVTYERVHPICGVRASGEHVTTMATFLATSELPDCALCGEPYSEHGGGLVSALFGQYCDYECTQFYMPEAPFRSKNWPFRVILQTPYHTPDGRILYGETIDEAVERLRRLANGEPELVAPRIAVHVSGRNAWRMAA